MESQLDSAEKEAPFVLIWSLLLPLYAYPPEETSVAPHPAHSRFILNHRGGG